MPNPNPSRQAQTNKQPTQDPDFSCKQRTSPYILRVIYITLSSCILAVRKLTREAKIIHTIGPSVQYNNILHNILLCRYKQHSGGNSNASYPLKKCTTQGKAFNTQIFLSYQHFMKHFCTREQTVLLAAGKNQEITCFG